MLLAIILHHNADIKALVGQEYSHATWVKYETTRKHVEGFLLYKYKRNDIHLKDLNIELVSDFEFYLKTEKKIDLNTNAKYIKNLKKIINECVAKNWLQKHPFLSEAELHRLEQKEFVIERLAQASNQMKLLPIPSNQKANAYLQEIAEEKGKCRDRLFRLIAVQKMFIQNFTL